MSSDNPRRFGRVLAREIGIDYRVSIRGRILMSEAKRAGRRCCAACDRESEQVSARYLTRDLEVSPWCWGGRSPVRERERWKGRRRGKKKARSWLNFTAASCIPPSLRIHTWVLPTVCGDAEGLRVYRWYREIRAHRWKRTEFVYKCVYMCVRARVYFRVEPAAYLRRPLSMWRCYKWELNRTTVHAFPRLSPGWNL